MPDRQYDVVLYGSTGFVGQQTVQYFSQHTHSAPVRWAIAGRNREKLEAVKARYAPDVDIWVADSTDQSAIDAIAAQTRIMLNTAGPFALYGNAIVDACVRYQTHYVDITGETPWVRQLCDRYQDQAAATGTRIIPCCGFDSVPSDLGTYLVVRFIQQEFGCDCQSVQAYFQVQGGFNGGTLASMFNLFEAGQMPQVRDPFLLNPTRGHLQVEIDRNQDPQWAQYEPKIGSWIAPFFMSPVNTRIVRRSAALFQNWDNPYGANFTYQEYLKLQPPLASVKAFGLRAGATLFNGLMAHPRLRRGLQSFLPQPGAGPSPETMENGWFQCELLGVAEHGQFVRGLVADQGDPGNRATVKMLCEAAFSLALQEDELPGMHRGGILTPATGLGEVLIQRLRSVGMTLNCERFPLNLH